MNNPISKDLIPLSLNHLTIDGDFWAERQAVNRSTTIPIVYGHCKTTGRIDAFKLDWKPGMPNLPHHFWDSDVAKWIEAAGHSLATHPDSELEAQADHVIDLIADAQQDDGYLNVHFTVVEPENRWTNLRDMHELYCAGHLMEAAVAYFNGTGKRKLLDVMCRYADYIDTVFGPGPDQKPGYPGHEEIELALVKLYHTTGKQRYLKLAEFLVNERGQQPHYFDIEARERGEDPEDSYFGGHYAYNQSHVPVREQTQAQGHAVRAVYLYAGMTDLAAETGDPALFKACKKLWRDVTERQMYLTGGIGASSHGERFTDDYDLPNDIAYAETCAAIGLVFWAHRMLQIEAHRKYADVMERALYNGVLSGLALDGGKFFYANPLEVVPASFEHHPHAFRSPSVAPERQNWFGCSCCPTNIVRILASLGTYVASVSERSLYVHLYVGGEIQTELDGQTVKLHEETQYPWDGDIHLTLEPSEDAAFELALRIPGWCPEAALKVNGEPVDVQSHIEDGYVKLDRVWSPGDRVDLTLAMPIQRLRTHPSVRMNCGRVALQRGPLVYCLEEADNGSNLNAIGLPEESDLETAFDKNFLGGVVTIHGEALRCDPAAWGRTLYETQEVPTSPMKLTAIPYYAWANRGVGEMLVWMHEA